jgi:hypothetical protein
MKQRLKKAGLTVLATSLLSSGVAFAEPPANIANTTWTLLVNRETTQLYIDTQGGAGAPGAAICRHITGKHGNVESPIFGWYCPSTGRIHFRHNNLHNTDLTVRVFTGNVSDEVPGEPLYMGGTVSIDYSAFGMLGETNFSATQVQ